MSEDDKSGAPGTDSVRLRLTYLLRDAALAMRRRFTQRVREAGLPLNQSEASILVHVSHEPGLHQAALSTHLDIEPIALVRLLDTLEEAGLIERRISQTDRRVRTIWVTDAAEVVLGQIDKIRLDVREEALLGFSDEARRDLVRSLVTIRGNLR